MRFINKNILPAPRTPIERKIVKSRNIIYSTTDRNNKALLVNNRLYHHNKLNKAKEKKQIYLRNELLVDKPLFIISTKNSKSLNKRSCLGGLIDSIQSRLPPILYRANRGDETSLLPFHAKSVKNQQKLYFLDEIQEAPKINLSIILKSRNEHRLSEDNN